MQLRILLLSFVIFFSISTIGIRAEEGSSPSVIIKRGSWSETVKDFIATTQDDLSYRRVVLQELLSSGGNDNSFADAVCSRPDLVRCLGNSGNNKGSANTESWPVEITIKKFNGTVHWEKLPKATQNLVIQDSPIPVDVVDLMSRLPNGIDSIRFIRCQLTTGGGNIYVKDSSVAATNRKQNQGDQQQGGNNEDNGGGGGDNNNNNNDENTNNFNNRRNQQREPQLTTLTSVSFEWSNLDATVLETGWLPVSALKFFTIEHCTFAAPSIAPLLVSATELDTIRIVSNRAPIRFRDLLAELSVRSSVKTINFQSAMYVKDNERIGGGDAQQQQQGGGEDEALILPPNLINLRLCNMSLRSLPKRLPLKLRNLELPYNKISGKIDSYISESIIELIDLSNNTLEEYPAALPQSIKRLRLPSNRLKGSIDFSALPKQLEEINVAHNQLTGMVDLSKLSSRLEVFDIAYNKFSGPINMREFPDSVRYVFLQHNEFTGRYDVSRLPLLSVKVLFGGNNWDSLIPKH